ncbi:MAG TPA: hypothetical protein VMU77_07205, partial [Acidimicrobiales bacterium]|nr:hypothetical protein [Acidimicrobiales bacterium]
MRSRVLVTMTSAITAPSNAESNTDDMGEISRARALLLDNGGELELDDLSRLSCIPDSLVPSLAALAHDVRLQRCGPGVEIEGILSAKTGGCPEDCAFCSQSARYESPVKATPVLDDDEVLSAARETAATGATEFCIVLAVRGPDERTLKKLESLVPLISNETGINVS